MADPSEAEFDVLKLFWKDGPLNAREVHERIGPAFGWAPSTTRTVLERMCAKGLLDRAERGGVAVFSAQERKVDVVGRALTKFARRVLEIDGPLSAQAFTGSQLLTPEEIAELQAMLDSGAGEEDPQ
jgi:predicted transcriptional regulator